jgi:hypothetical protein
MSLLASKMSHEASACFNDRVNDNISVSSLNAEKVESSFQSDFVVQRSNAAHRPKSFVSSAGHMASHPVLTENVAGRRATHGRKAARNRSRATISLERAIKNTNCNDAFLQKLHASLSSTESSRPAALKTKAGATTRSKLPQSKPPLIVTSYPKQYPHYLGVSKECSSDDVSHSTTGKDSLSASKMAKPAVSCGHDSVATTMSTTTAHNDSDGAISSVLNASRLSTESAAAAPCREIIPSDKSLELAKFVRNVVNLGAALVQMAAAKSSETPSKSSGSGPWFEFEFDQKLSPQEEEWAALYSMDASIPSTAPCRELNFSSENNYPQAELGPSNSIRPQSTNDTPLASEANCKVPTSSFCRPQLHGHGNTDSHFPLVPIPKVLMVEHRAQHHVHEDVAITLDRALPPNHRFALPPPLSKESESQLRYRYKRREFTVVNRLHNQPHGVVAPLPRSIEIESGSASDDDPRLQSLPETPVLSRAIHRATFVTSARKEQETSK